MRVWLLGSLLVLAAIGCGCKPGSLADESLRPKPAPVAKAAPPFQTKVAEPEQGVGQDLGTPTEPPATEQPAEPAQEVDASTIAVTNGHIGFVTPSASAQSDPFSENRGPAAARSKPAPIRVEHSTVKVGTTGYSVRVIRVPLAGYSVQVVSAKGRVGPTEALGAMAARAHALAAINGCFFDAYLATDPKLPFHTVVHNGAIQHFGKLHDTVLGFDAEGGYKMDTVRYLVRGELSDDSGRHSDWWAYRINHPGGATLYSRDWNQTKTPQWGTQVMVRNGVVEFVGSGPLEIPADGYVLVFDAGDRDVAQRFWQGAKCTARFDIEAEDHDFWIGVREAIGCGPRLVRQGSVHVDPVSEEFSHPKILTLACPRSGLGVTEDGTLLMVVCSSVKLTDFGMVMKKLGAYEAMNLDGGGSCALWSNGRYLAGPGRDISNALLVVKR